jgi:hypothetical protein
MNVEPSKYPDYPPEWWERGPIPRDIDAIYSGLVARSNTHPNWTALSDVAQILRRTIQLAFRNNPGCGMLLGELLAFLWKKRLDLAEANYYFETEFSKLESARPATRKHSALRRLIEKIISDAQSAWLFFISTGDLSPVLSGIDPEELRSLPEFGSSEAALKIWTEVIVYPTLLRMEQKLRDDPEIGSLKKALDDNGKFHLSCLKPLIRQTVRRIATVPRAHYFDVSDLSLVSRTKHEESAR